MDPRGLRARLTGAGCTSCGAAIPGDGIDVLADRGDVAFVELRCVACGSRTMSVVVAGTSSDGPVLDTAQDAGLDHATAARLATRPAIDLDDVDAVRRLLDGWSGDLRSLMGDRDGGGTEPGRSR
jgi:hypothetical protein